MIIYFYLYSNIFIVLPHNFYFSGAFRQSLFPWQGAWLFGKAILHDNSVFHEDLNKLLRPGLDGRKASEQRVRQG